MHSDNSRYLAIIGLTGLLLACDTTLPIMHGDDQRITRADSEPYNWLSHGRTYDEQRFSPLSGITDANIDRLGLAWYTELNSNRGIEATPIIVDGSMYVTGAWSIVHAIDARNGNLLWSFDPEVPREWSKYACCDAVNRGVAVWQGRVYVGTLDGRLIAIDAVTGEQLWATQTTDKTFPYTITGAPRFIKGNVVIGNGGADYGVRGYVSGYEAKTGQRKWRFFTVPGDPAKGFAEEGESVMQMAAETWSGEWWRTGGGGTVWNAMAFDPELNLLYIGVGNGTPWSHKQRSPDGGDNLFLSSIVAINPDNGEYAWHYQTTPGESWNFSATESIILADLTINGQPRKTLIQAPKNGFFYVLDRRNGELISAKPYVTVNWASHIDPESGRPVEHPFARYGEEGRVIVPGASGGHSWHPMSYSPLTSLAYIPTHDVPNTYRLNADYEYRPGLQNTGIVEGVTSYDALNPSGGKAKIRFGTYLTAWDPVTQQAAWKQSLPDLGGGTLATAGNLVFQGTGAGQFVAYRADDGEPLWSYDAGTSIMPGPVSYAIDGEQYIAVMLGRGGGSGLVGGMLGRRWQGVENVNRVVAFKLDARATLPQPARIKRLPEPPGIVAAAEIVQHGKTLYHQHCYVCHGLGAEGGGVLPDLRYASAAVHAAWFDIVIDGLLAERGMRSWADVLDTGDAAAIQAYVATEARVLLKRIKRKQKN
ncbi:MAG TPA: PQQ-dependent dehydrogenase, methanol/ethanol family [Gammaproteobacteria bacterium]|nr:PQQ-dependent dehydrogenase, methanol/ethanol family [Chromatiales bacterium]MCP4924587.1 PQQ-dependent dehydrogenase, methanol/ethanol family [Gammaproteobacteria bacterium]MDP7154273.1 PQQ-dependent dehydrogenase, methanol/ethanol family [Gammaproteobacteria bacterium]MDP7296275.1 PQQ-dependent dehydrogenase, methanol/ethanol family [Gammaproteobacteria bacterium]MDP7661588.1 PQQ-dependent dehydrogenase, methanol/ethanol family [Gammaproteobacteria bacterium]